MKVPRLKYRDFAITIGDPSSVSSPSIPRANPAPAAQGTLPSVRTAAASGVDAGFRDLVGGTPALPELEALAAPVAVRVRGTAGEASGRLEPPFQPDELQRLCAAGPSLDGTILQRFGDRLYEALFTSEIRTCFVDSFRAAKKVGEGLRIKLDIAVPALNRLPWEILRRTDFAVVLAQSEWFPVVRYLSSAPAVDPVELDGKPRMLVVSASPRGSADLDLPQEVRFIEQALAPLGKHLDVTRLKGARKLELSRELRQGAFHVVHFMGHGGRGLIQLEGDDGGAVELGADDLRQLVFDCPTTQLIVFNACDTARATTNETFSGLAAAVAQAGVPAVVSMQYPVSDDAAILFAKELYLCLGEGYGIDQAVTSARYTMKLNARDGTNEWMTPVLHLSTPDGVIFRGGSSFILPHHGNEGDGAARAGLLRDVCTAAIPIGGELRSRFVMRIGPRLGDRHPIEVVESPAGTGSGFVVSSGSAEMLARLRSGDLDSIGESLFGSLFMGEVGKLYADSLRKVGGGVLELRLDSQAPEMDALPWECLRDPGRRTYLAAASAKRPFRRQTGGVVPNPYRLRGPLRVLFVAANPLNLPPLGLQREWEWLSTAAQGSDGRIEIDRLVDPTPTQVMGKLGEKEFHVFHFAGYDRFVLRDGLGEGIVLTDADGSAAPMGPDDLIQLLSGFDSIRLVVTNTCNTATTFAPALVRAGIPSAIGMRLDVGDDIAVRFTQAFYSLLSRANLRVDTAITEARKILCLETQRSSPAHWSYATLFTSVPDDDFFSTRE